MVVIKKYIASTVTKAQKLMGEELGQEAKILKIRYIKSKGLKGFFSLLLLVLGVGDFIFQKWKFRKDMRMSKQEIKDERKQTQGNEHIKSQMQSMMQSFTQTRVKDDIPKSDVVIVDLNFFAVSIKYDDKKMQAPMCVAKGAKRIALVIKDFAKEQGIPVVENRSLAQALYKNVEVGSFVSSDFYHPIAQVLAHIDR
jgi:flagellar biosynthetic protein FlhB